MVCKVEGEWRDEVVSLTRQGVKLQAVRASIDPLLFTRTFNELRGAMEIEAVVMLRI